MKVAVAGGCWSTNIGNSFFNLGTVHILRKVAPGAEVVLLSDQPGSLDFRRRREPKNSLNIFDYIDVDYLVLHGSVLTKHLPRIWGKSLRSLHRRGTRTVFISAGLFEYSREEVDICKGFLAENPPFVFISRDSETYSYFSEFAEHSYNGIDSAFFLPELFTPMEMMRLSPYVVLSFDKSPEPFICCTPKRTAEPANGRPDQNSIAFEFRDDIWQVKFPYWSHAVSKRLTKFYPYFESVFRLTQTRATHIEGYNIIRVDHQFNPLILRKIFRYPNSFCWDLPYPYLCLYANADLTLTDRIHAAVAALAYGRPAMLFSESGRSRVLARVAAINAATKPISLDQRLLTDEKQNLLDFLSKCEL